MGLSKRCREKLGVWVVPVCGHDPNHKVNGGRNICSLCGGHGHIWYDVAEDWAKETGYDDEFLPYLPPSPPSVKPDLPDTHVGDMPQHDESQPSVKTEREEK